MNDDVMIDAIYKCHAVNLTIIDFINKMVAEVGKPKHSYESCAVPEELFEAMKKVVTPEEMEEAVFTDVKQVREENIRQVTAKMKRRSQIMKNGLRCFRKQSTSIRRRQSAR